MLLQHINTNGKNKTKIRTIFRVLNVFNNASVKKPFYFIDYFNIY